MTTMSVWAALLLAAASGQVLDADGRPIAGAEACCGEGLTMECVRTDAAGFYRIEQPTRRMVFIRAKGFVSAETGADEQVAPIRLGKAATLTVRVVDAVTGEPVSSGRVILTYTSGKSIGDSVPFNKNGVRITTLRPGEILARSEAEGYDPGGPEGVKLDGGDEKILTIGMRRRAPIRP